MIGHDPPLALAVIAVAPGLENAGRTDGGERAFQIFRRIDRRVGRGPAAQLLDKVLLAEAVLRGFQRAGVGQQGNVAQCRQRPDGDILELIGHHRAITGKARHGFGIVPGCASESRTNLGGDAVGLGRVDVAAIAKLRRRHGQHPAELAAAQNSDGFARRDHVLNWSALGWPWHACFDKLSMSGSWKNIRSC